MRRFTKRMYGSISEQVNAVRSLLEEAISNLSGLQQWAPYCDDARDVVEVEEENKDIVRDIAMAITGENIKFETE